MKATLFLLIASLMVGVIGFLGFPTQLPSKDLTTPTEIPVAPHMEPAPNNCGPDPEPVAVSEHYAPVLGSWPIWGTLVAAQADGQRLLAMPLQLQANAWLKGWWAQKVLWLINTSYVGEVHLTGYAITDGSPLYFSFSGQIPTDLAILNPENPGAYAAGSDQFANFPSTVWVSKAGCYRIEAEWEGGLWQQLIAVGRREYQPIRWGGVAG